MKKRLPEVLLVVLCISFFAADSAGAAGERRLRDPGDPAGSTVQVVSEERYIGQYFEADVSGKTKHHIYLGDQMLGTLNNKTELFFIIPDHVGSSSILITSTGTVAEMTDYKPFGTQTVHQTSVLTGNQYTFAGKEIDPESTLQYFGARYLNNDLARFSSTDPLLQDPGRIARVLGDPQQLNSYAYGRNNPLSFMDPTGEKVELVRRPVGEENLTIGAHAFVLITNNLDDARGLMDVPGVADKTKITLGGYTSEQGWIQGAFGDLVKHANYTDDYDMPESRYLSRVTIQKPEAYRSQSEFENAVLQSYLNLPDNMRAYSFLAHPTYAHQANSNNAASTILLNAGVPQDQIVSGLSSFGLARTPGLGVRIPAYSSPSAKLQYRIARNIAANFFESLGQKVSRLFR